MTIELVRDDESTLVRPLPGREVPAPHLILLERAALVAEDFVNTPVISGLVLDVLLPLTIGLVTLTSTVGVAYLCAIS
jgi:hypothetical protein